MTTENPELDPKRKLAIVALLEKPTIKAAAEHIGIGETTLHRWLRDDTFATAYRQAQKNLYDHALGIVQSSTASAAQTLRDIMTDEDAPETARVTAARTLLDFARQHISLQDLEERIASIEAARDEEKESRKS
jgi:hypothetical protein